MLMIDDATAAEAKEEEKRILLSYHRKILSDLKAHLRFKTATYLVCLQSVCKSSTFQILIQNVKFVEHRVDVVLALFFLPGLNASLSRKCDKRIC